MTAVHSTHDWGSVGPGDARRAESVPTRRRCPKENDIGVLGCKCVNRSKSMRVLHKRYRTHVGANGETEDSSLEEEDHEEVRLPNNVDDREDGGAPAVAVLRHARTRESDESLEAVEKGRRRAGNRVGVRELPVVHSVAGR